MWAATGNPDLSGREVVARQLEECRFEACLLQPDSCEASDEKRGNQLQWCPSLSGMDGSVVVDSADGRIYDFTIYYFPYFKIIK